MQLRVSAMLQLHGSSVAQASPNASPYDVSLQTDYVGFIAIDDLFRSENLMPVNRSFLHSGVSLSSDLHAYNAWIEGRLIVHRSTAVLSGTKMPGLPAGHLA
jgi:hypothetical protein